MCSIMKNNTWILVDFSPSFKTIGCKWIQNENEGGWSHNKLKASLVIKDFTLKKRINYFDTYAITARIATIRILISLALIYNLVIH